MIPGELLIADGEGVLASADRECLSVVGIRLGRHRAALHRDDGGAVAAAALAGLDRARSEGALLAIQAMELVERGIQVATNRGEGIAVGVLDVDSKGCQDVVDEIEAAGAGLIHVHIRDDDAPRTARASSL